MRECMFIKDFFEANHQYVLEKFNSKETLAVANKADANDLLTEVDLTVQKRFVEAVAKRYPDDLVVGEESGLDKMPEDVNRRFWLIDPIDGTYNFVRGMNPAFAVSIAFVNEGYAQAAGVSLPRNGIMLFAEAGSGAFCNDKKLVVSTVQRLEEACIEIDFGGAKKRRGLLQGASQVLRKSGQLRCQGSAAVGICQVASGDVDGYVHAGLPPWDYAAAQLIAEEAGAIATHFDGSPLELFDGGQGVLIANGAIHETLVTLLNH